MLRIGSKADTLWGIEPVVNGTKQDVVKEGASSLSPSGSTSDMSISLFSKEFAPSTSLDCPKYLSVKQRTAVRRGVVGRASALLTAVCSGGP